MPFTAAHPAAVLPLRDRFRGRLPWSALVIGAMAPDFEYFLLLRDTGFGHSLPGLFLFCVPAGLVVWLLFHLVVKRPIGFLLPESERRYLAAPADLRPSLAPRSLGLVAVGLVVGAATHLGWDAFTHAHGWGVRHLPILRRTVLALDGYDVRAYSILQHGSTLLGLGLLALAYLRWRRDCDILDRPRRVLSTGAKTRILILLVAVPVIAGYLYAAPPTGTFTDLGRSRLFLGRFVTSGIAAGTVSTVVCAVLLARSERR